MRLKIEELKRSCGSAGFSLHTPAVETTGNAHLGEGPPQGHQEHLQPTLHFCLCHTVPILQTDSSPSHNCVLAHLDPCVSSDSPRFISASPRLHGVWGLDLSHVSGSFTSMDGWSVLPWSSVFMGMFRDSEIHIHTHSNRIGELPFSVASEREQDKI